MKHKSEYEAMVTQAKKREAKDAKLRKRLLQRQMKQEDFVAQATRFWNEEVLPNWTSMRTSRKVRELWWQGLPPSMRGKAWKLAIGNDLSITSELYEICVMRAKERLQCSTEGAAEPDDAPSESPANREDSVELIRLDVSRTFPHLCIFQKGGPYHDLLQNMLGAYACYRPDVGYVQGMSFLAAMLLLNMDVADAFICFSNLLNRPCHRAFFRVDNTMMKAYFATYEELFEENLPKLYTHFEKLNVTADIYLIEWLYTSFSKSLPLDVACRVWDIFCRDGEEFFFRTALGVLRMYEDMLLNPDMDFIHTAQFLTKLPDDISAEQLFRNIEHIRTHVDKRRFSQVLAHHMEAADGSRDT
ncbi:PREDICTED: TBC1 domain family member 14-like [Priapulus caudatus]|uniref:TBC1 domain family member 14-like n=1 Tax=Priapulus caudatus TaxID=37621 RepID=A0ABM1EXQ5_PRICU|nr:PREDICTED: TBC1 domain family member 14-like [Priapulus caudatus]XP_014676976.1 PREDICTED: TBC1 domain family member 14-like [Priapulus caudatus]